MDEEQLCLVPSGSQGISALERHHGPGALSALVLISNTMTTLVAEQTSEIGVMGRSALAAASRSGTRFLA